MSSPALIGKNCDISISRGSPRGFREKRNMALKLLGTRKQKEIKLGKQEQKLFLGNREHRNRKKKCF